MATYVRLEGVRDGDSIGNIVCCLGEMDKADQDASEQYQDDIEEALGKVIVASTKDKIRNKRGTLVTGKLNIGL